MAQIQQLTKRADPAASLADREVLRLDLRFKLHVAYANGDKSKCLALMEELDISFDECRNPLFSTPKIVDSMELMPP